MERRFVDEPRTVLVVSVLYVSLALLFTGVSQVVSPASSDIGTFRSLSTIPGHLSLIFSLGLLLGLGASIVQLRFDFSLTLLIPIAAILTNVDHLPSFLGILQPIRPAHSLFFASAAALLIFLALRRPDASMAIISGFTAHLAVDTGLFPPFSPFSFSYYYLGGFMPYLAIASVASALLAGLLAKRNSGKRQEGLSI